MAINYATRSPQVRRGTSSAWLRRSSHADQEVVGRRVGRNIGGCPAAAAFLVAQVVRDPDGKAGGGCISSRLEAGPKAHRQLLRPS